MPGIGGRAGSGKQTGLATCPPGYTPSPVLQWDAVFATTQLTHLLLLCGIAARHVGPSASE